MLPPLPPPPLLQTSLPATLKLVSRGKVRDIYDVPPSQVLEELYINKSGTRTDIRNGALLFVATDRISAYDVILKNGIPQKGVLLTELSAFWFNKLADIVPNHVISTSIEEIIPVLQLNSGGQDIDFNLESVKTQLSGRTMLVRKAKVIPIEAIVRGYLTGSAWSEYKTHTTVHSMSVQPGLIESQKFPEPLFTPSTKAEVGMHDENISAQRARDMIGVDLFNEIERISLALYKKASQYAESKGLILADTKFEFGLIDPESESDSKSKPTVLLIDELLTPDSSRYWPMEGYEPGKPQPSFDKQYLRNWMVYKGFKKGLESGPPGMEGEGWVVEAGVVEGTRQRYVECVEKLVRHATE